MSRRIARLRAQIAALDAQAALLLPSSGVGSVDEDLDAIEQALQTGREDAARDTLLAGAVGRGVHDLRGALSPAMLTAERLQANPDPAVSRTGDLILRIVERCGEVMDALAASARDRRPPMTRERLPLRPIIDAAGDRARQLYPDLRIETTVADDMTVTLVGPILMRALIHLFVGTARAGARRIEARTDASAGPIVLVLSPDGLSSQPHHVAIAKDLLGAIGAGIDLSDSGIARLSLPYTLQRARA